MENNNKCGICIVGIIFALLEIFIVVGESLGLISYYLNFDSFLFIIFLVFIVSYENKNRKNNANFKGKYPKVSKNGSS
ncbi:MAG: hypothetical protein ACFFCY_14330 [Promethearchaeota archaeon]